MPQSLFIRSRSFFIATFAFSWFFWIPAALQSKGIWKTSIHKLVFIAFGSFGPSLVGLSLIALEEGRVGLWKLCRNAFNPKIPISLYLIIAALQLVPAGVAYLASGGRHPNFHPLEVGGAFVLYFFLGGSLGEEIGWRGFVLPRLLEKLGPVPATLILGVLWTAWHLPLCFIAGTTENVTPVWLYLIYVTALSFQYTWIFKKTGGSLFTALILHTFTNITVVIFPPLVEGAFDKSTYWLAGFNLLIAIFLVTRPSFFTAAAKTAEPTPDRSPE